MMNRAISYFVSALVVASLGCGPFLLIPGGRLSGDVSEIPKDWSSVRDIKTIQLESRPSDPYSVNLWATAVGPGLYVHAGTNRSAWIAYIESDPRVRIRIEDKIYELRATRVDDPIEFALFADTYEKKFGTRPRNENVDEVYLMRLEAR